MKTRTPFVGMCGIVLALFGPSALQAQIAFPDVCLIRFDQRHAAALLRRNDGRADLSDLLREAGSIEVRSDRPVRLALHVYEMHGKDVVRRYVSPAFTAPAGTSVSLAKVLLPGQPQYGNFSFDPSHLVEGVKTIPADDAVEDPVRFAIDGVIPFRPKHWEQMATFYVVAVPADRSRSSRQSVGIGIVYGTPGR